MKGKDRLSGKKILIVDDEPDVLEALSELFPMCEVLKASTFQEGKELLSKLKFEIAILDIMGVNGYELLKIALKKNVIPVMLTAHALTVQNTRKAYKMGAASYVPKEKMSSLPIFLDDILEAKEREKNLWWRWLDRLDEYYAKKFGADWKNEDTEFWDRFKYPPL